MGSPLSPILADIVMENLISTVIKIANIPPKHIRKYVDDLFLLIHKNKLQEILDTFNNYNKHIQFTCEVEQAGKLPFLDLLVIRMDDNTIKTDWYAKPISSGRLLNFNSFHPMDQKVGLTTNYINRVRQLSTVRSIDQQNIVITDHLIRNDYPIKFINRMLHQSPNNNINEVSQSEPTIYKPIPFIHGLTQMIRKTLHRNIPNLKTAPSNRYTVKSLLPTAKDPLLQMQKNNIIYKIACFNCDQYYIGMSRNQLKTRMYGHQSLINKLDQRLADGQKYDDNQIQELKERTALMEHCISHQHRFDLKKPHNY
ncbi:uncharacterized protein LOC131689363 [Topomyia yanbarensis]|uniref:uncharacterized protein LOC131689363 n=1 Tax=Topomyia yanbarensis TaxID=2498891 RepID=UPI00273BA986|nr:uncharacterized protein LOC131689363 [Topomyia yanbarensis]